MMGALGIPTVGLVESWSPGSPPHSGYAIKGFNILGTGTIDLELGIGAAGVSLSSHTISWAIRKNGVAVASDSTVATGFRFWAHEMHLTVTGLEVEPDDKIWVTVTATPTFGIVVPAGTGGAGEQFKITGGSLV